MGIRESLNKNPVVTTGVTAAIIVVSLFFAGKMLFCSGPKVSTPPNKAYYTTDTNITDPAQLFIDDIDKAVPFDKDGKKAVRAIVFECPSDKKRVIVYYEKLTESGMKEWDKFKDAKSKAMMAENLIDKFAYMKPGGDKWYTQDTTAKPGPDLVAAPFGESAGAVKMQDQVRLKVEEIQQTPKCGDGKWMQPVNP